MKLGRITITRSPRKPRKPRKSVLARLPKTVRAWAVWLLVAQGFVATMWITLHEVAYRRFLPAGEQEFELRGLISHAGSDMLLLAGLMLVVCLAFRFHPSTPHHHQDR